MRGDEAAAMRHEHGEKDAPKNPTAASNMALGQNPRAGAMASTASAAAPQQVATKYNPFARAKQPVQRAIGKIACDHGKRHDQRCLPDKIGIGPESIGHIGTNPQPAQPLPLARN